MNVLFLEDRGATAFFVERWLKENGHNVLSAFNPNDAQSHWNKRDKVPIHCIILDLRTPTEGLDEKQKKRAAGGNLSGWVWLRDKVLTEIPEMRERTIIYSDYTHVLYDNDNVPDEEYNGITIVPKKQRSSAAEDVVIRIREIAKLPTPPQKVGGEAEVGS